MPVAVQSRKPRAGGRRQVPWLSDLAKLYLDTAFTGGLHGSYRRSGADAIS
jgi:hypothetical protein